MKDIADIIAHGESEVLEFKRSFNAPAIQTLVAFANTRGGSVVIGVTDTGELAGQRLREEALRDYTNRIATATEPSLVPMAERHSMPEGDIITLSVTEFPLKPVATRGRCYRRAGSTTRQMSPSEIAEMHLRSTGQSMDAVIVEGKSRDDLDLAAVRQYMRQATAVGRRSFGDQEIPGQLPFDVTVDDLFDPEHTSKPRNKLIAQIFYDMRLIERYGSGISRILDACGDAGLPTPLFENFSGGFRIKFMLPAQVTGEVTGEEGVSGGVNEGVNEGVMVVGKWLLGRPGGRGTRGGATSHFSPLRSMRLCARISPSQ